MQNLPKVPDCKNIINQSLSIVCRKFNIRAPNLNLKHFGPIGRIIRASTQEIRVLRSPTAGETARQETPDRTSIYTCMALTMA